MRPSGWEYVGRPTRGLMAPNHVRVDEQRATQLLMDAQ